MGNASGDNFNKRLQGLATMFRGKLLEFTYRAIVWVAVINWIEIKEAGFVHAVSWSSFHHSGVFEESTLLFRSGHSSFVCAVSISRHVEFIVIAQNQISVGGNVYFSMTAKYNILLKKNRRDFRCHGDQTEQSVELWETSDKKGVNSRIEGLYFLQNRDQRTQTCVDSLKLRITNLCVLAE